MKSRNGKKMMAAACRYAYSRFVLNYEMYYETLAEEHDKLLEEDLPEIEREEIEKKKKIQDEFFYLVGCFLKGENPADKLEDFRSRLLSQMDDVMHYLGYFSIYEYVLERIRGRFFPSDFFAPVDDELFANKIIGSVISIQDSGERNKRIKDILSELPMRFTKAKFFSLAGQALSVYEGTSKISLEQQLQQLYQEGTLTYPQTPPVGFEHLHQILLDLERTDYRHLDKDNFQILWENFVSARDSLLSQSSYNRDLMELMNDFYVICLTYPNTLMDIQEKELFHTIITLIWEGLENEAFSLSEGDILPLLIQTEGRQETYYEQWERFAFDDLSDVSDSEKESEDYIVLWKISQLLSTSLFMSLEMDEEESEEDKILLSRRAVEEMCQSLFDKLEISWKGKSKYVIRSVMAQLLSILPMFFLSTEELRQFVLGCLSSCTDLTEKAVCVQSIQNFMEMNNDLV